jgi:methanol metabolism-related c-type cytochrome
VHRIRPHPTLPTLIVLSLGLSLGLGLAACNEDKAAPASQAAAETKAGAPAAATLATAPAATPAGDAKPAAAAAESKPAADAQPAAPATTAETKVPAAATPPAVAPAAQAAANDDNAAVQAAAKAEGAEFKDGRYRDKDGRPMPVVTKDYKVDWATWQGFRRYHDACHVCHGPNALGSTFAPSLGDSLKTMDYETFFGIVVGGRVSDRGGTKYVMPAFGEDKNVMCYLDDIYTYIKARSINMEGKGGMPAGRPNGREDISPEARAKGAECFGEDQTGGGKP